MRVHALTAMLTTISPAHSHAPQLIVTPSPSVHPLPPAKKRHNHKKGRIRRTQTHHRIVPAQAAVPAR
ncbi:hypothetical protein G4B88_002710 [Cannabis sativa]|uniref:Uncharacterized protein n=1 Tax=Cannabis sativa TaxID=3483 RepID=A0A7J6HHS4_CANSA|nr:hypothetical protein G4B88_002710 [Cannabis sativa]